MERRTYESPMDWEYQTHGPMDPSSPFVQSARQAQSKNTFGSSAFGTFNQNPFMRTQSSPSKPATGPTPLNPPSIFSGSPLKRMATAPPFRNPAFTTPRKPIDADAMSEVSAAESSPTVTDASELPDTPDPDQCYDLSNMTLTPATMNKNKLLLSKKASGKGEIARTIFASREKVRKRKRYNSDRDVSGYRLPYIQQGELEDSDYESDESTFEPGKAQKSQKKKRSEDGWFGNFLAVVQRHPYAPSILGYWLNLTFSFFCVMGSLYILWAIVAGLREDFAAARQAVRDEINTEIGKCIANYRDNKCEPLEQRLPAMHGLCEQWAACMSQNPDTIKNVQLGAKNIVEIVNEIIDTMSYKTIALFVLLFAIFVFSGRSLYRTAHDFPDFNSHRTQPVYGQHQVDHMVSPPQQVYWQAIQPQTPRRFNSRHYLANDETPDTDGSPPRFKALTGPQTPLLRRSPSKGERGRSPTKSRSPSKRY
ncbi:Di-sulfide bridge nucleocytoplasmic transport domain-containing protein [Biscogniauxia mediterranea]|nr:Di-sulfide bridge nucleocytoplasmic transport domain-containing protein [Biscogniauxia mediterranea]